MTGLSTHIGRSWFFFFSWVHASRLQALKHRRKCHTENNTSILLSLPWQLTWGVPAFSFTLGSVIWTQSLAIFSLNPNVCATADSYSNLWCIFFSLQLWLSLGPLRLSSYSAVSSSIHRGPSTPECSLQCLLPAGSAEDLLCVSLSSPLLFCASSGFFPTPTSINCLPNL